MSARPSHETIRVVFRLDDPSQTSDRDLENGIIAAFASRNLRASFAVVPYKEVDGELRAFPAERAGHLIDAHRQGTLEIALHGCAHRNRLPAQHPGSSEFAGIPEADQLRFVAMGKAWLESLFDAAVTTFVPPWNSFDTTTLDVLRRAGLDCLSAAWDTPAGYAGPVTLLPHSCHVTQIREAVADARRIASLAPVVVVIMHHYDFLETGSDEARIGLQELHAQLDWLCAQADIEISTLGDVARGMNAHDTARAARFYAWKQRLHWRLQALLPSLCFVPGPASRVLAGSIKAGLRRAA